MKNDQELNDYDLKKQSFIEAAKPLIKWLNENVNPHHSVIVTTTGAELLSGEICFESFEFVQD